MISRPRLEKKGGALCSLFFVCIFQIDQAFLKEGSTAQSEIVFNSAEIEDNEKTFPLLTAAAHSLLQLQGSLSTFCHDHSDTSYLSKIMFQSYSQDRVNNLTADFSLMLKQLQRKKIITGGGVACGGVALLFALWYWYVKNSKTTIATDSEASQGVVQRQGYSMLSFADRLLLKDVGFGQLLLTFFTLGLAKELSYSCIQQVKRLMSKMFKNKVFTPQYIFGQTAQDLAEDQLGVVVDDYDQYLDSCQKIISWHDASDFNKAFYSYRLIMSHARLISAFESIVALVSAWVALQSRSKQKQLREKQNRFIFLCQSVSINLSKILFDLESLLAGSLTNDQAFQSLNAFDELFRSELKQVPHLLFSLV